MTIWKTPCPMCRSDMTWTGFDWTEDGYLDHWKCFGVETHVETTWVRKGNAPQLPAYASKRQDVTR